MTYDFVCPRDIWIDYPRPLSGLSGHAVLLRLLGGPVATLVYLVPPPGLCYVAASGCYSLTGEDLMCPLETRPGTFSFGSLFCLLVFWGTEDWQARPPGGVSRTPKSQDSLSEGVSRSTERYVLLHLRHCR